MPRLLVFVPCEKVIISRDENNPTLVAIMSQVGGSVPDEAMAHVSDDKPSGVPFQWSVFTMWYQESGDVGRKFEQVVALRSPSGKELIRATQGFELAKTTHRLYMRFPWFPVETGTWSIELFLHEMGTEIPVQPIATYPIKAKFVAEKSSITKETTTT